MPTWSDLQERASGKWQLPLLVVSLGLLLAAILRIQPSPTKLSQADAITYLDGLIDAGLFDDASRFANTRLDRAGVEGRGTGPYHLRLARARFGQAEEAGLATSALGRTITDEYNEALSRGESFESLDYERLGRSFEWQGDAYSAVKYFELAVDAGVANASDLRKHLVLLLERSAAGTPSELNALLDELLVHLEPHRLDLRIWTLDRKLHVLDELDNLGEAATLMVRNEPLFAESDFEDRFRFLQGFLLFKQGQVDQAETFLRTIRNGLERESEVHAMTGWLLGRAILDDESGPQRPLEALSFFTDVITAHPGSLYSSASRLESARAFAYLERHEEAIEAYQIAIEECNALRAHHYLVDLDTVRASLSVTGEMERQAGRLESALAYAALASTLIDTSEVEQSTRVLNRLAQSQAQLAEQLESESLALREASPSQAERKAHRSREFFTAAAKTQQALGRINLVHDRRAAEAGWLAADLYARAGQIDMSAELFEEFAREHPADALVPRALFRVGKLYQSVGRWDEAIETYQRCYRRFPRTLDAARGLVPLAACYLARGPGQEELAQKTLEIVLQESNVFTPQAPDFADALFLMGDVLNRRQAPERAIATLEEALTRYPDDSRATRTRFLLADSYRRSALGLVGELSEASYEGELEQMRSEATARFTRARGLYRRLIEQYELQDLARLGPLARMYYNLSILYEADCYFETQEYRDALTLYEEAVAALKDSPRGLSAYVQIINCHVFLGQPAEARAALARAMIAIDGLPVEVFARGVSPESREDWRGYFSWLGESELF